MPLSKLKTKPKLESFDTVLDFEAIGTLWSVKLNQPLSKTKQASLSQSIKSRIDAFDKNYSRFRNDSLVGQMAQTKGKYRLPDDAKPLIDTYRHLYDLTGGLMTPLVGQMLADSGYDATYSFKPKATLRRAPAWDETLDYNYPNLEIKQTALLDFGAAGKGYLIDLVGGIVQASGIKSFSVNAGGDIFNYNLPASLCLVGLEHPINLDEIVGVAELGHGAICGSAINRRSWGEYNHIFNPGTMKSVSDVLATWVVSQQALIADALSTALFFVSANTLNTNFKFDYALIRRDLSLEYSASFPARFYT